MIYHMCGPYNVVVNSTKVDAVDAIVWKEVGKEGRDYSYDVILESGERVTVDGFSKFKEAEEDRNDLLSEGLLIDLEDDDAVREVFTNAKKTIKEAWELEKGAVITEESTTKIIPLIPEVAESVDADKN